MGPAKPLQASGQIRRLPDRRLLSRLARSDRLADDHEARGDPDAHLQWLRQDGRLADRVDHRERGTNRPFGIRLVRFGPAEIDQHAITHVARDEATEARDRRGHAGLIAADHCTQILGVQARGQCRESDHIAEHHAELAALGGRCSGPVPIIGGAICGLRRSGDRRAA